MYQGGLWYVSIITRCTKRPMGVMVGWCRVLNSKEPRANPAFNTSNFCHLESHLLRCLWGQDILVIFLLLQFYSSRLCSMDQNFSWVLTNSRERWLINHVPTPWEALFHVVPGLCSGGRGGRKNSLWKGRGLQREIPTLLFANLGASGLSWGWVCQFLEDRKRFCVCRTSHTINTWCIAGYWFSV